MAIKGRPEFLIQLQDKEVPLNTANVISRLDAQQELNELNIYHLAHSFISTHYQNSKHAIKE